MKWREQWKRLANRHLERHGHQARIDAGTLEAQGIDREATIHLGPRIAATEAKGRTSARGQRQRGIQERNQERGRLKNELRFTTQEIAELQAATRAAHEAARLQAEQKEQAEAKARQELERQRIEEERRQQERRRQRIEEERRERARLLRELQAATRAAQEAARLQAEQKEQAEAKARQDAKERQEREQRVAVERARAAAPGNSPLGGVTREAGQMATTGLRVTSNVDGLLDGMVGEPPRRPSVADLLSPEARRKQYQQMTAERGTGTSAGWGRTRARAGTGTSAGWGRTRARAGTIGGDRGGHRGSRNQEARKGGAIGKGTAGWAKRRAPSLVWLDASLWMGGARDESHKKTRIPRKPLRKPRRRRRFLNEPVREPVVNPQSIGMSRFELYQWHKRIGTLHIYFDLYPSG